jgi:regulator of protease activity HflC (stomatin/prohibitin superfamily)
MTIFDSPGGRVIDANAGGAIRLIGLAIAGLVLIVLLFNSVTRVATGHVGVLTLFGKVTGETLGEGIHVINPLKTNNEMSVQTQSIKESASVPSSEGLMMSLDTSLIYHLNPDHAAEVFQKTGADYEDRFVEPTLRSAIREATASHSANALYTGEREMVGKQIFDQLSAQLSQRGLTVENVLLRDIQLPPTLKASIETKQQAEQEALAMNFRLQKETQEAQRKRIEAQGIRDFQQMPRWWLSAITRMVCRLFLVSKADARSRQFPVHDDLHEPHFHIGGILRQMNTIDEAHFTRHQCQHNRRGSRALAKEAHAFE